MRRIGLALTLLTLWLSRICAQEDPTGTQERILTLITRLGAPAFVDRETAGDELVLIGPVARTPLERAFLDSEDPEVQARARETLFRLLNTNWAGEDDVREILAHTQQPDESPLRLLSREEILACGTAFPHEVLAALPRMPKTTGGAWLESLPRNIVLGHAERRWPGRTDLLERARDLLAHHPREEGVTHTLTQLEGLLHEGSRTGADRGAAAVIVSCLLFDPDPAIQQMAVSTLGAFGERAVLDRIRRIAFDAGDPLQYNAMLALGNLGDEDSIPAMMRALDDEEIEGEIKALSRLGVEEAFPRFADALRADPFDWDTIWAIETLRVPGSARALLPAVGCIDQAGCGFCDPFVGAGAIARLGDRTIVPDLIALVDDPDEGVRSGAIEALVRLEAREAVHALSRLLGHESKQTRYDALLALSTLGCPDDTSGQLHRLIEEGDAWESSHALVALVRGGDRAFANLAQRWLREEEPNRLRGAATTAGPLGLRDAAPRLRELLHHEESDVRGAAFPSLATLEGRDALPLLTSCYVRENDWRERERMQIAILPLLPGTPAADLFAACSEEWHQRALTALLGACGDRAGLPVLLQALLDPSPHMRSNALRALRDLGLPEAAGDIEPLLSDPVPEVRAEAARAAIALAGPDALRFAARALNDACPAVREAAARAVARDLASDTAWPTGRRALVQAARNRIASQADRAETK